MMSSGSFPFLCSVTILLVIKTVQRLPSAAGCCEENAFSAISRAGICREDAKFSKNDPQPDEQASFTTIFVITPLSSQIAFIS